MTAAVLPVPRTGAGPGAVARLHLTQWRSLVTTPIGILGVVFVITAVIALVFLRLGSVPGSEGWIAGSRNNPAIFWALPGFFGWLGVQTVSLTFPLALSLGSTRRAFVTGTVATHLLLSAYLTALMLVVLLVERLTNQWFLDIYVADVFILGAGDPLLLATIVFLGALLVLSVGGAMAAAWVRHGAIGPIALSVGAVLVLAAIAVLVLPPILTGGATSDGFSFGIGVGFGGFWPGWLAVGAGVVIVLSVLAQYLLLRRAAVR